MLLLFWLGLLPSFSWAIDCNTAPNPAMRTLCEQLTRWDEGARKTPAATAVKPPAIAGKDQMAAEFAPIAANMYQCMDMACLCVFFRGTGGENCVVQGQQLKKAYRKEYRMLSDDERNRFHTAMRSIKTSGEFDRIARIHSQFASSGAAHSGPAFLPWHREYMKRVEIALRQVDPTVALPYWDSTLDQNLQDSKDSLIWTNEFMGETDASGMVVGGPFRQWPTIQGGSAIRRAVGAQAKLFSEDEINWTVNQNNIANVLAFTAPRPGCPIRPDFNVMEYTHGNPHLYVGGEMVEQSTAANDPIFYMHHSFVDLVWELYRQNRQDRASRERDWPPNNNLCSSEHHFSQAFMRPFSPLRNADGLSNMYTDNLYTFAPRPSCNMGNNCGSPLLFCDRSHGASRCASKMKPGGKCGSYTNGEDVCYKGSCQGGVCVGGITTTQPPIQTKPPVVVQQQPCYNEHECCGFWSKGGECNRNFVYMSEWCKASCGQCNPNYDLNAECSDRHPNCNSWSQRGECQKNPLWMSENCRQACRKCDVSRANTCSGGQQNIQNPVTRPPSPTQPSQQQQQCNSPGCFNEDICCSYWAEQGGCQQNPIYMLCNCKVACGQCRPAFQPGTCNDYHQSCRQWASSGECVRNKWMPENCRRSCITCVTRWDLQQRCGRRMIRNAFIRQISGM